MSARLLQKKIKHAVRRSVGPAFYESLHDLKVRMTHGWRLLTGTDPWFPVQVKVPIERHGDWFLCPAKLTQTSIVYSLGIGRDVSFDLSVIKRFGVDVHAFDPTPSALEWLRHQSLPAQFHVMPFGVAGFDGAAAFNMPLDPANPSFAYQGQYPTSLGAVTCQVRRLSTLMEMLGHTRIDLLKVDIEGAEYEVIDDLVASALSIQQLLVEFHHRKKGIGAAKTRQAVYRLEQQGFRLFHVSSSGQEMAFIGPELRSVQRTV